MSILKGRRPNTRDRLERPLPVDPETGLYCQNFFLLRLKEERERSKRTGNPFSLLVADIADLSVALNGKAGGSAQIQEKKLIKQFLRQARAIDIKGWFDVERVGILMPETREPGALEVRQKICQEIRKNWPSAEDNHLGEFFEIYGFSSESPNGNGSSLDGHDPKGGGTGPDDNAVYADILRKDLTSTIKRGLKRILDIIGSLFGIGVASPLMVIIAVLIKLTSPGPILFRQERIGFLGRKFTFLKFRSMAVEADQGIHQRYVTGLIEGQHDKINKGTNRHPLYKMTDDPRVTRVGHILRKTSLDELPQFFNILKGDMSLVGPRPPIPYEVEKYRLWHHGRVLEVKPGLTGLWQVSGRSQTSFDDMVRLDLRYAQNWSLWLDLKIILKTLPAVFSAKGAY